MCYGTDLLCHGLHIDILNVPWSTYRNTDLLCHGLHIDIMNVPWSTYRYTGCVIVYISIY